MKTQKDADAVILTIIPEEYEEILAAIGNTARAELGGTNNLYGWREGNVGSYRVVVGKITQAGTNFAQAAAVNALQCFDTPLVLVVGIAGGLPHKDGVERGDVVIGTQVFSYEYGKLKEDGYHARVRQAFANTAVINNAAQLPLDVPGWYGDSRRADGDPPRILTGGIASGDKLIDSLDHPLAQDIVHACAGQVLAVEMESWGCAVSVQQAQNDDRAVTFGVVRGISDLPGGDGGAPRQPDTNAGDRDRWKRAAAHVAARLTVALLRHAWPYPPRGRRERAGSDTSGDIQPRDPEPPPAPSLRFTLHATEWNASDLRRFHYSARATRVYGYTAEQAKLVDFAFGDDGQRFRWWLMVGPGGAGKSRLAFELCHAARERRWQAGFLNGAAGDLQYNLTVPGDEQWQPDAPTLLVLDYAQAQADTLGALVHKLTLRRTVLRQPVRVLLLERDAADDWYRQRFLGSGTRATAMLDSRHADPLALGALDGAACRQLLDDARQRFAAAAGRAARSLDELAAALDVEHRPLFALFLVDALAHAEGDALSWDQHALLAHVLAREEARWQAFGITDDERELLLIATLCGGFALVPELPAALAAMLERIQAPERPPLAERLNALTGRTGLDKGQVPALEPDLIGELFVLRHLDPPCNAYDTARKARFEARLDSAWAANPAGTAGFISRAARDFPHEAGLDGLLLTAPNEASMEAWVIAIGNSIPQLVDTDREHALRLYDQLRPHAKSDDPGRALAGTAACFGMSTGKNLSAACLSTVSEDVWALRPRLSGSGLLRWMWAITVSNLCVHLSAIDRTAAEALYAELKALAVGHDEPALCEVQASVALNLIAHLGAVDRTAAEALYAELKALAAAHDEPVLREWQAKAAASLINAHLGASERRAAEGLYAELKAFAATHDEPALREWQAIAAFNLINAHFGSGDRTAAERLYAELRTLATAHDEPVLREAQAKAATNLIINIGAVDRTATEALYAELRALAASHDEAALREQRARAVNNLIVHLGSIDHTATETLYAELKTLAAVHDEPALREWQAIATFNLINAHLDAVDHTAAERLYAELRTLTAAHDEPALREQQAKAATNLIVQLGAIDCTTAETLYAELKALAAGHDEPALREQQAMTANSLITHLSAVDRHTAEALYAELKALAAGHDEPALREWQAIAAVSLINAHLGASDRTTAERLYAELRTLAAAHDEPVLREAQAKAATNLLINIGAVDRRAAEALYAELKALAATHDEPTLREAQAKAAVSLIAYRGAVDRTAAEALYAELEALVAAHDEPALRETQAKAAFNLLNAHLGAVDHAATERLYVELKALATAHDEPVLRETQTKAAVNLIAHLGAVDRRAAEALYAELKALAAGHDEPALREEQARAAFSLINAHLGAVDRHAAEALYAELEALATGHDEPVLREQQARAAFNLLAATLPELGAREGAATLLQMGELAQQAREPAMAMQCYREAGLLYAAQQDVRGQVMALIHLVRLSVTVDGNHEQAQSLLDEAETLARQFGDDDLLRMVQEARQG